MIITTLLTGFILGLSQIAVIGLQNAFILKNGIRGRPMFKICLVCSICDIIMIGFGVFCAGASMSVNKSFTQLFQILGAAFLLFYGAKLFKNSITKNSTIDLKQEHKSKAIIGTIIAVSILNPHAWVDAVIVIGAMSTKYIGIYKICFAIGCMIASVIWFFILGYFSKKIAHLFHKPITWQILDFIMAFVMWYLAFNLIS